MKRPRILRSHLRAHYVHGTGDSNEHGLFGNGLFPSMGFDEFFLPFESAHVKAELDAAKAAGPYDAAFFMPYQEAPTFIRKIVGPTVPVIAWIADDQWRFDFTRQLIAANAADLYITTDRAALPKYAAAGVAATRVVVSAFGTRPDWWPRLVKRDTTANAQATFTGLLYADRFARLKSIADAGPIAIDVNDTGKAVMSIADYHQSMADSAFTLALTAASHGMPQMKARLFEPQLHGSILVTEPLPELADYWTPDEECIVFATPAEAQDKMCELLEDADAFNAMAERAYRRALMDHSFQARMANVFDRFAVRYVMPDFSKALLEYDG